MDFRDGNAPRKGLVHMNTVFEDEKDREIFEKGNVQRFHHYASYGSRPAALMFLTAGCVFAGFISGQTLFIRKLRSGLRPDVMLGWMCQGFEWFVIQNGKDKPIIWDGYNAVQSKPDESEMPIGGAMAFIHHMIAVCSTDGNDKIALSDRWAQTKSDNVWKFKDTPTWDNAGVFGLHANFGKIMNLMVVPQIKQTPNGQGDLLIGGTNGGQTLNVQVARADFLDSQIQDTALVGSGFASYVGVQPINSSIYFVGQSGLEEVLRRRGDFTSTDADTPESGDVDLYWKMSNPGLRAFTPLGHHDNRLFMGTLPETALSSDWGTHRFFNAWLTLDVADRYRSGQKIPRAWYGLQCGIRPIEWASNVVVNREHRTFVLSHDIDGINRVYEHTTNAPDDVVGGIAKKVKAFFVSPALGARKNEVLRVKRPLAARLDMVDIDGNASVSLEHRGVNSMCWNQWSKIPQEFKPGEEITEFKLPGMYGGSAVFSNPTESSCSEPPDSQIRIKVNIEGQATVQKVYVKLNESDSPEAGLRDIFFTKTSAKSDNRTPSCQEDFEIYHNQP